MIEGFFEKIYTIPYRVRTISKNPKIDEQKHLRSGNQTSRDMLAKSDFKQQAWMVDSKIRRKLSNQLFKAFAENEQMTGNESEDRKKRKVNTLQQSTLNGTAINKISSVGELLKVPIRGLEVTKDDKKSTNKKENLKEIE